MTASQSIEADLAAIAAMAVVPTILEVVCRTTGLGFSAVARVTDSQWIACAVRDQIAFGLEPGGELPLQTTICNEIRGHGHSIVIEHVAEDASFRDHPTPRLYGFQSYISVPIWRAHGELFGTLCAIDSKPARLHDSGALATLELFARLIGLQVDSHDRLRDSESSLSDARGKVELQDQFVAVLGHDLRNPLSAIQTGAHALTLLPQSDDAAKLTQIILRSARRATALVESVLDFAKGRLGSGLDVERVLDDGLAITLKHVVSEVQTAHPARPILMDLAPAQPVFCDQGRIAQLLANLLSNAVAHGAVEGKVWVRTSHAADAFELSVTNEGRPIPAEAVVRLFQPFQRGNGRHAPRGLGLGLYIASEIARAHDGSLSVASNDQETRFTFRMPARAQ